MDDHVEKILIHKINTLETMMKVLLDELIDSDTVDFDSIMERLDDIEKAQEAEREEIIASMYFGPTGEA